jgi:hypothetical protein
MVKLRLSIATTTMLAGSDNNTKNNLNDPIVQLVQYYNINITKSICGSTAIVNCIRSAKRGDRGVEKTT